MNDAVSHGLLFGIVALCLLSSAALAYYARVMLPKMIRRRIRQSALAFSKAIELRFPAYQGLTERVVVLSVEVGRRMGLRGASLERLELSAHLRDIGLCGIPYRLVNEKSTFLWDEADWATYSRHAEVSGAMLELVPYLRPLARVVRLHHTPYAVDDEHAVPQRTDIPLESRILHVVADFAWHSRLEGSLLARDRVKRGMGTAYDPVVVDALLQVLTSTRVESRAVEPVSV